MTTDKTGDRLTPSHSKTSKGRRLRYYVSHRLVRGNAPRDPSGWRLPAPELESKVADLIALHMNRPDFRAGIIHNASTEETADFSTKLSSIGEPDSDATSDACSTHLALVHRIDIAPGELRISVSPERLAVLLDVTPTRVVEDLLSIAAPFQHRKRGVETKLIIGSEPAEVDKTLLRNIGHAHRYFDLVRSGKTIGEIAETEGFSKRRVQQLIELAVLAPDVTRSVREGRQPTGLTSDWLLRHAYSPIWSEQRDLFSTL
ncbi:hypothetical protein [Roseovarius amoyensis]|uniref:hypothetical protein n=1 Tax=Roseovarius amoyensis TaxID=2211448 RepID=UPI0013A6F52B|nr:hypothetical protein [Roseovarius amoyensis]